MQDASSGEGVRGERQPGAATRGLGLIAVLPLIGSAIAIGPPVYWRSFNAFAPTTSTWQLGLLASCVVATGLVAATLGLIARGVRIPVGVPVALAMAPWLAGEMALRLRVRPGHAELGALETVEAVGGAAITALDSAVLLATLGLALATLALRGTSGVKWWTVVVGVAFCAAPWMVTEPPAWGENWYRDVMPVGVAALASGATLLATLALGGRASEPRRAALGLGAVAALASTWLLTAPLTVASQLMATSDYAASRPFTRAFPMLSRAHERLEIASLVALAALVGAAWLATRRASVPLARAAALVALGVASVGVVLGLHGLVNGGVADALSAPNEVPDVEAPLRCSQLTFGAPCALTIRVDAAGNVTWDGGRSTVARLRTPAGAAAFHHSLPTRIARPTSPAPPCADAILDRRVSAEATEVALGLLADSGTGVVRLLGVSPERPTDSDARRAMTRRVPLIAAVLERASADFLLLASGSLYSGPASAPGRAPDCEVTVDPRHRGAPVVAPSGSACPRTPAPKSPNDIYWSLTAQDPVRVRIAPGSTAEDVGAVVESLALRGYTPTWIPDDSPVPLVDDAIVYWSVAGSAPHDRADARASIAPHAREALRCYERRRGTLRATVHVEPSGLVTGARLEDLAPDDAWIRRCIGDLLAGVTFPRAPSADGAREVVYDLDVDARAR